jgi:hypothetical protein
LGHDLLGHRVADHVEEGLRLPHPGDGLLRELADGTDTCPHDGERPGCLGVRLRDVDIGVRGHVTTTGSRSKGWEPGGALLETLERQLERRELQQQELQGDDLRGRKLQRRELHRQLRLCGGTDCRLRHLRHLQGECERFLGRQAGQSSGDDVAEATAQGRLVSLAQLGPDMLVSGSRMNSPSRVAWVASSAKNSPSVAMTIPSTLPADGWNEDVGRPPSPRHHGGITAASPSASHSSAMEGTPAAKVRRPEPRKQRVGAPSHLVNAPPDTAASNSEETAARRRFGCPNRPQLTGSWL